MPRTFLVAGLAYGDEGKGATVDYLTRTYGTSLIVRYNGGAQAAHNVVTSDGRHHTFSQFGSGMFVPEVRTHLSRFVIVNPDTMIEEESHLREVQVYNSFERTTIDKDALVVTPFHQSMNKLLEWSREFPHGSCGMGIGQARALQIQYGQEVLYVGDLIDEDLTRKKLKFIRSRILDLTKHLEVTLENKERATDELDQIDSKDLIDQIINSYEIFTQKAFIVNPEYLNHSLRSHDTIFEGAQGVLLDETYGQFPHNTWTDCTFTNAITLLSEANYTGDITKVGVLRSYFTRHGAGPFFEDYEISKKVHELHNTNSGFQGKFRVGKFDPEAVRYSLSCIGGVDWIALNHLDEYPTIPSEFNSIIKIVSSGPTASDRKLLSLVSSKKEVYNAIGE